MGFLIFDALTIPVAYAISQFDMACAKHRKEDDRDDNKENS